MTDLFGIRDEQGRLRRFVIVKLPKSYRLWDRNTKAYRGGCYRALEGAVLKMQLMNGEIGQ